LDTVAAAVIADLEASEVASSLVNPPLRSRQAHPQAVKQPGGEYVATGAMLAAWNTPERSEHLKPGARFHNCAPGQGDYIRLGWRVQSPTLPSSGDKLL
jgi:hypothetical protein